LLAGIGCRGKIADDLRGVLHWTDRDTIELQHRHLADDGQQYTGEVWCVTVPSGAFIIRRNGRVSVSGNSGFPKSMDVSKAIDKAAGATREVVGTKTGRSATPCNDMRGGQYGNAPSDQIDTSQITAPATEAAKQWEGWGTALKPAFEPIVVARKPLDKATKTVAANVLEHGTGALNIDACRVQYTSEADMDQARVPQPVQRNDGHAVYQMGTGEGRNGEVFDPSKGRWPTNVLLDGAMADVLDEQTGMMKGGAHPGRRGADGDRQAYGEFKGQDGLEARRTDGGGGSRFFPTFRYQAKAPAKERPKVDGVAHPTVKPLELMRWLIRLVTPPDGVILDPFAGSGTTLEAAMQEGVLAIGIEFDPAHLPLIMHRIERTP
jgi:hypothetical protein